MNVSTPQTPLKSLLSYFPLGYLSWRLTRHPLLNRPRLQFAQSSAGAAESELVLNTLFSMTAASRALRTTSNLFFRNLLGRFSASGNILRGLSQI